MTNKEIAQSFQLLGQLMHLHNENKFKIRSYESAYRTLRSWEEPLAKMPDDQIATIKGVGKAIHGKIRELLDNGKMNTLERYKSQTPEGIQEMLNIKGFGPKKIRTIWQDLNIETIGELLYAVNENRLIELKGFGQKTQEDLKQKLEYYQRSKHKFHYAALESEALDLLEAIPQILPNAKVEWTGAIRRRNNELEQIELLLSTNKQIELLFESGLLSDRKEEHNYILAKSQNELTVKMYLCQLEEFGSKQFRYTAAADFLDAFIQAYPSIDFKNLADEKQVFEKVQLPYIAPELREQAWSLDLSKSNKLKLAISTYFPIIA